MPLAEVPCLPSGVSMCLATDLQILVVTLGHMEIKQTVGQTRRSAEGRLLLASASQDKYIRIWVLREASTARTSSQSAAPAFARSATLSSSTQPFHSVILPCTQCSG